MPELAKAQPLPEVHALGFLKHEGAQRNIRQRQAAVPEQIGFIIALAAGLETRDDLAELGMQRFL